MKLFQALTLPLMPLSLTLLTLQAQAQQLPTVTVQESAVAKEKGAVSIKSEALPAQVNILDAEQLERLNISSTTDLYRTVPGVQAISFGQGDIGAPFVMRGFGGAGSHGVATAFFIDGVPQNVPSGGIGGNGTSEYNWLTPEMIDRVEVIKGPFSAMYGDQALAGVVNIVTKTCAPSSIGLEIGSYGLARTAGTACGTLGADGSIKAFGVFEAFRSSGYRDRSDYGRFSLFGKLTTNIGDSEASLRANVYRSGYEAPGYLDINQLKAGLVNPRSSAFATDGGDNTRYSVVGTFKPRTGEAGWYGTAYFDRFDRTRFGSFNLASPLLQSESTDKRNVFGGRLYYNYLLGNKGAVTAGLETRQDRGDIGSFASNARVRTGVVNRDYGLDLRNYAAFVQAQYAVLDSLKVVGGVRYDRFEQTIDNRRLPARSGSGSQSAVTPRIGVVYTATRNINLFANAGEGFRSVDVQELSPAGAVGFKNFDIAIPKGKTLDVGFNAKFDRLLLNGSAYRTNISSETRQDPPNSGILVNNGATQRDGFEADARYFATDNIAVYGSYAQVKARIKNPAIADQTTLPNVVPRLITLGVEVTRPVPAGKVLFDLYFQHRDRETYYVGAQTLKTDIYQIYNARVTYKTGPSAYTAYLVLQPREFASDQAGTSFNPLPRTSIGVSYKYTF